MHRAFAIAFLIIGQSSPGQAAEQMSPDLPFLGAGFSPLVVSSDTFGVPIPGRFFVFTSPLPHLSASLSYSPFLESSPLFVSRKWRGSMIDVAAQVSWSSQFLEGVFAELGVQRVQAIQASRPGGYLVAPTPRREASVTRPLGAIGFGIGRTVATSFRLKGFGSIGYAPSEIEPLETSLRASLGVIIAY